MHLDARDLQAFYDTQLGQLSSKFIRRKLRDIWPSTGGLNVLGLGYTLPYLRLFRSEAQRTLSFMPAQQGVLAWPPRAPNASALVDEASLPLPDGSMDRIIVCHLLENSESLRPLLRQIWRILSPAGRVIFIVPNRTSLWAQFEATPFGHGRPFTRTQIDNLLVDALFTPTASTTTLHMPPIGSRYLVRSGMRWDGIGKALWPKLAGVHLMEATKEVAGLAPVRGKLQRVPFKPMLAGKSFSSEGKSRTLQQGCPNSLDGTLP